MNWIWNIAFPGYVKYQVKENIKYYMCNSVFLSPNSSSLKQVKIDYYKNLLWENFLNGIKACIILCDLQWERSKCIINEIHTK